MKKLVHIFLFISISLFSIAQEKSYNNYTGIWNVNSSWEDGSFPTQPVNSTTEIFGYITRNGNLEFTNFNDLKVYDTLVVIGDVLMRNKAKLLVEENAVLIILGDYTSENQLESTVKGTMVVTGEFTMVGSDNQGKFENDGKVFIFDPTPDIKDGPEYEELYCNSTVNPDSCGYGIEEDIYNDPIGDFFSSLNIQIDYTGSTTFCNGESITLSTDDGTNHQWYINGLPIPGETGTSLVVSTTGDYTVSADVNGGNYTSSAVSITVTVPNVNLGADQAICAGSNLILDAGAGMSSYLWSTTETTQSITINTAGTYVVTVTDANGCQNADAIVITENALPVVNLGPDQTICSGGSLTLDAGAGMSSYLWSTTQTTQTISVNTAATYSIQVTDANGCQNSDDIVISTGTGVDISLSVADVMVCNGSTSIIQVQNSENNVEYSLRLDSDDSIVAGPIAGNGGTIEFSVNAPVSSVTQYNVFASSTTSSCTGELTDKPSVNSTAPPQTGSIYHLSNF